MEETEKKTTEGADTRIYEVSYLLTPTTDEADINAAYTAMKDFIAALGAEHIADEMPKKIELAYTMDKVIQNVRQRFDEAYFGWFKFAAPAEKIADLKKMLDLDTKVIRHLIIKTVRENTVAVKRYVKSDMKKYTPKVRVEGEAPAEINKEEIDKEIDAMIEA